MSFIDVVTYDEVEKFQRTDLTPYREVFDNLKPGVQATLVVDTGEFIVKQDGTVTKRGEIEKAHERAFRAVATERNVGLQVGHNHMPGNKTRLRLMVGEKRQFTPEALKKREEALAKSRESRAADKLLLEHPDWTREQAVKHYRTEKANTQKAAAPVKKAGS